MNPESDQLEKLAEFQEQKLQFSPTIKEDVNEIKNKENDLDT